MSKMCVLNYTRCFIGFNLYMLLQMVDYNPFAKIRINFEISNNQMFIRILIAMVRCFHKKE